jgi:hypothetical protein
MADRKWLLYEEQLYHQLKAAVSPGAEVAFDHDGRQRLPGRFSRTPRQIDVIVRGKFAGLEGDELMIVDCKLISRRLDVTHVEAFAGLVDDVGATLGLLVTSVGYSEAAKRRAEGFRTVRLDVVLLDELGTWLARRPQWAIAQGATWLSRTYRDEVGSETITVTLPDYEGGLLAYRDHKGVVRGELVSVELAERLREKMAQEHSASPRKEP